MPIRLLLDGSYKVCFQAYGYKGAGWALKDGHTFFGGDGVYKFSGHINESGGYVVATMDVSIDSEIAANTMIRNDFKLNMTGTLGVDRFSLLGTGPLGVIIEIECSDHRAA
jgi:hypothetical protein